MAVPGEPGYITACRCEAWTLTTWTRGAQTPALHRHPARCKSWRHHVAGEPSPCARWRAALDWRRIADAFKARKRRESVYMVLSVARESSPDGPHDAHLTRWSNPAETWGELAPRFWRLVHRLQRQCCRETGCERRVLRWRRKGNVLRQRWVSECSGACDKLQGRYVSVVEQHKPRGPAGERWPHVNVVFHWPWLAQKVAESPTRLIPRGRGRPPGRVLGPCELLESIVASGWGYQSCAEIVKKKKAVAGYLIKHAAAVERVAGEVAKQSQLPVAAPSGFRRLRAGRGFLARPFKSGGDGAMVRKEGKEWRPVSRHRRDGALRVETGPPLARPSEPTTWLDMRNRRVYTVAWEGWDRLPRAIEDPSPAVMVFNAETCTVRFEDA